MQIDSKCMKRQKFLVIMEIKNVHDIITLHIFNSMIKVKTTDDTKCY